ncbi:MAG: tetratricopeptide repeat protein [Candidatus Methanomethylophilaceae archaeon]|jgi:TPR repeat protein|nr:tetratricopeptide repeat protein [Candidatus Methanomethylophilaceae archaeon]
MSEENPEEESFIISTCGRNGCGAVIRMTKDQAATSYIMHAAEAGNATAMLRLARKYLRGEDFAQDYELALRWFKRSAESGNDDALYHVGVMYLKGMGTEADVGEARSWLERSAAAGCDKASELLSGI